MGRFFLGFLIPILLIALFVFGLWVCDMIGIISINNLVLEKATLLPGLEDLAENYQLGQKQSELFKKKEEALQAWQKKLEAMEAKLAKDISGFEAKKMQPLAENITDLGVKQVKQTSSAKTNSNSNAEVEKYLALIGGMKPEKAAVVIQKLPLETVYMIFDQIRASQATKIMESLPADYVVKLTQNRIDNN